MGNLRLHTRAKGTLVIVLASVLLAIVPYASLSAVSESADLQNHWDMSSVYVNDAAWQADYDRLLNVLIPEVSAYQGKLGDPEQAAQCLLKVEEMSITLTKVYQYANLAVNLNNSDNTASERLSSSDTLYTMAATATAFVEPELLAQDAQYLGSLKEQPGLEDYEHYLETLIKRQPHTLSAQEESILAAAQDMYGAPENIYTKLTTVDMTFPILDLPGIGETQLNEGNFYLLRQNADREVRRQVYEAMLDTYRQDSYTLTATLEAQVRANIFYARARHYDSALNAALDYENIPREVYDNLMNQTGQRLDTLHRYVELRRRVLGVDKVHGYDTAVPLVPQYNRSIPYSEAQEIVLDGLGVLGSDYTQTLQNGFNNRWVDVYPAEYKTSGAFAAAIYGSHPFILLNYDGTYDGVLTLAHEGGHAMYFDYSSRFQPYVYSDNPIVTHEVASTTNELLVTDYLINNAQTDAERLYLLNLQADNIVSTLYGQLMYAEFEQKVHEIVENGGGLTPDALNEIWGGLLVKYFGESYQVDEYSRCGWMRIPHFYYDFYVYKYSLDIAAAQHLVGGLESGDPAKTEAYLEFLKAGSSDYPVATLQKAGVDISDPAMVNAILDRFDATVTEIDALMVKQGMIPIDKL